MLDPGRQEVPRPTVALQTPAQLSVARWYQATQQEQEEGEGTDRSGRIRGGLCSQSRSGRVCAVAVTRSKTMSLPRVPLLLEKKKRWCCLLLRYQYCRRKVGFAAATALAGAVVRTRDKASIKKRINDGKFCPRFCLAGLGTSLSGSMEAALRVAVPTQIPKII